MNKTVLVLVTHMVNEAVISEYRKMKNTPYVDAYLAINNYSREFQYQHRVEKKIFYGLEVNCFFFDEVLHKEMNLPNYPFTNNEKDFGRVVLHNSDNHFYYFKKCMPNYDFYWRIEYDVFCNSSNNSYSGFLEKFKNNNDDLLITGYQTVKPNCSWAHSKNVEWIYSDDELYRGFFPVVRLSNRAIDFLQKRRMEHINIYETSNVEKKMWPHCELFVPMELVKGGFSCSKIDEPNVRWRPFIYLNDTRFFEEPDNRLYHPVKSFGVDWAVENDKLKRKIKELELAISKRN